MDFSKMTVDEIIDYLYTEALKGHVFSTDQLDKAVDACSLVDRSANADAITIFYGGGEDAIINEIAATGNSNVRLIRRTDAFKLLASKSSDESLMFDDLVYNALKNENPSCTPDQLKSMTTQKMYGVSPANSDVSKAGE